MGHVVAGRLCRVGFCSRPICSSGLACSGRDHRLHPAGTIWPQPPWRHCIVEGQGRGGRLLRGDAQYHGDRRFPRGCNPASRYGVSPELAVNAWAHESAGQRQASISRRIAVRPILFVVTGFLIDPVKFAHGIFDNFLLVSSIVAALANGSPHQLVSRTRNGYNLDQQLTIWSLTLPQVAATLRPPRR